MPVRILAPTSGVSVLLQRRCGLAHAPEHRHHAHLLRFLVPQLENEELRMGQALMAAEVQSLRRDLSALAARSQVLPAYLIPPLCLYMKS